MDQVEIKQLNGSFKS